ncbi:MBL fold metallo-hydrolase [Amycolatopsis sp.]|jgi:glyoxylase-like metal-dependent hydrolase (beta-lactamase superfamily II)|uniref:MBL fold metallo-hydrolase n=1 Tax=Amycolatopsis sp. TaxID=37632 RepID=UPI002E0C0348|nr:MBL fold metallo-hydrolase [Amycolatopsis sp.]
MGAPKVHHLNCGTMRLPTAPLVCHVLLLETDTSLILVDTGFGLRDIADPRGRLGSYRHVIRPVLDSAETAIRQVEALGFAAEDVRHIVLTHLDSDHAGGLADFPQARVHTTATEWAAAREPATLVERNRYRQVQWSHGPQVVTHDPAGEAWRGFPAAKELSEITDGLVMISLPGHTRGHAAYAVDTGKGWLLHAGDAFYHHSTIDGQGREPLILTLQERMVAMDRARVRANHEQLARLHRDTAAGFAIFSAHDPSLLTP